MNRGAGHPPSLVASAESIESYVWENLCIWTLAAPFVVQRVAGSRCRLRFPSCAGAAGAGCAPGRSTTPAWSWLSTRWPRTCLPRVCSCTRPRWTSVHNPRVASIGLRPTFQLIHQGAWPACPRTPVPSCQVKRRDHTRRDRWRKKRQATKDLTGLGTAIADGEMGTLMRAEIQSEKLRCRAPRSVDDRIVTVMLQTGPIRRPYVEANRAWLVSKRTSRFGCGRHQLAHKAGSVQMKDQPAPTTRGLAPGLRTGGDPDQGGPPPTTQGLSS